MLKHLPKLPVPFRMHTSGWCLFGICVLLGYQIGGWKMSLPVAALLLASLLLHEAGHMLMATALGVPVYEFGLKLWGAYNRRAYANRRRDEVLISMSGPLVNLALVLPLLFIPHVGAQLAIDNLALCIFNLLPIPSSDGMRIVKTIWGSPASPATPASSTAMPLSSTRVMMPGMGQPTTR